MNEKKKLLKRIQVCDFVLMDVKLYLDSHPCDRAALEHFKKYQELREKAYCDYIERFGPLMAKDQVYTDKWTWVDDPWPWEKEA